MAGTPSPSNGLIRLEQSPLIITVLTSLPPDSEESTADQSKDEQLEGWKKSRRISWAKLIRKVFEVDPMLCSFCGGTLETLAFTLELGEIRKFLTSIDCPSQEPEPLGHSPPQGELVFEPC